MAKQHVHRRSSLAQRVPSDPFGGRAEAGLSWGQKGDATRGAPVRPRGAGVDDNSTAGAGRVLQAAITKAEQAAAGRGRTHRSQHDGDEGDDARVPKWRAEQLQRAQRSKLIGTRLSDTTPRKLRSIQKHRSDEERRREIETLVRQIDAAATAVVARPSLDSIETTPHDDQDGNVPRDVESPTKKKTWV